MSNHGSIDQLAEIFDRAGRAHHQAFHETNGDDADWPAWYAAWLLNPLSRLLDREFSGPQLADLLASAHREHRASAPNEDWRRFYARYFLEQARSTEPL